MPEFYPTNLKIAVRVEFRPYATFAEAMSVKASFLDHVKLTNEPEAFPGLCHDRPPIKDARFLLIVDEFSIDPSKRADGEFIRCAACATRKKFKRGSLAWYPDEGVLRVVGNECGDHRRAEAREDYKRRNTLDVLNSSLSEHLPGVHSYLSDVGAFRPAARHAQELSLQLRTQATSFGQELLRALKVGDGKLAIFASEVQQGGEERPVVFARPEGVDFLRAKYQPLRLLDEAVIRLQQADRGSPSKARRWLASHAARLEDLKVADANLVGGLRKFEEARAQVAEVARFLARPNLEAIDGWARARRSPLRAQWGAVFTTFRAPPARGQPLKMVSLRPDWRLFGLEAAPQ